jgi:hypothetical protein
VCRAGAQEAFARGHQHHCRLCGQMFCSRCTGKYHLPPRFEKKKKKGAQRHHIAQPYAAGCCAQAHRACATAAATRCWSAAARWKPSVASAPLCLVAPRRDDRAGRCSSLVKLPPEAEALIRAPSTDEALPAPGPFVRAAQRGLRGTAAALAAVTVAKAEPLTDEAWERQHRWAGAGRRPSGS